MTDPLSNPLPEDLAWRLLSLLDEYPSGTDELSLVKRLAADFPDSIFAEPDALRDPLKLFRVHFLLFHTLYRLADGLAGQGRALKIHAMRIAIEPQTPGTPGVARADPLRAYYLDWRHWAATQAEDVDRLLADFWNGASVPNEEAAAARELFGLSGPVDPGEVRRRYRKLVRVHHPDRGGETEKMQQVNRAYLMLKRYYRIT